ncbi:dedicator of cytokinesis protein 5-like [Scleropages formosus]|uniref:Dedicator of cytokinesis protein 5-like n=1 Tax=Scleropages formosus TaxID=113540 RepID=A0A0P7UZ23_SCLFO|nr:dedicator of cytokinesis protein 5-like [Scleropages formosus]
METAVELPLLSIVWGSSQRCLVFLVPGNVRNDIYVTLLQGEFERSKKKTPKNVEVMLSVLDEDGNPMEKAVFPGAGYDGITEYKSIIYYQVKQPCWNETVKVTIPIEDVCRCHLRLMFRHRSSQDSRDKSEKTFGMAFVHLMKADGTTLRDGKHDLIVYKVDAKKPEDAKTYQALPGTWAEAEEREKQSGKAHSGSTPATKDSFQIATLTCSTKLTQNVDLLGLLNWRSNPQDLVQILQRLMEVEGGEIVKFLQDTLDALFSIMMETSEEDTYDTLVFNALVFIISLIGDIKFQHFNPVLETYITKHFSATLAYKFYGTSEDDDEFFDSIRTLFLSFNVLMDRPLDEGVKIKGAILKYLPTIINDILHAFDPVELSVLLTKFIESIPDTQLVRQKLGFMCKMVESELFRQPECRDVLLPMLTDQLSGQLDDHSHKPDYEACVQLLSTLLDCLDRKDVGPTRTHVQVIVERLLRRVNRTVINMSRTSPLISHYLACMAAILKQMDDAHHTHYISAFRTRQDIIDFLMETFIMFRDLIGNVFPSDWMIMNLLQIRVFLRAINQYSEVLNQYFLDQTHFQLQQYQTGAVNTVYGDMRKSIGFKIRDMWYNLGPHKMKFIPSMVGPILEVTLVPEPELRKATIPIFFDMMQCEHNFSPSHTFQKFENELITKLDQEVEGGRGDEQYKVLLEKTLLEHCRRHRYLFQSGEALALLLSSLLGNLLAYRTITHDESPELRMSCTVNVLNFYKEKKREDIYIRYLYKLRDLHLHCENYTEAAYTLLLHAELLEWSDKPCAPHLIPRDGLQGWTQQELKEKLFQEIICYLDKGKVIIYLLPVPLTFHPSLQLWFNSSEPQEMWEKAIEMSKQLARMHEDQMFDFVELSQLLKQQAQFYENIMHVMRPQPEYFAVGYYGLGFPSFLRNKVFIYRGKEYEWLEDFSLKLLSQFPVAVKMMSTSPPGDSICNSSGQCILGAAAAAALLGVVPYCTVPYCLPLETVVSIIPSYYRANEVDQFQYSRPFRKGEKDPDNEFATMWIERTTYVTAYRFPGILKWFEVKSISVEEISPLQNAIETMEMANEKLGNLVQQQACDRSLPVHPLSMMLNGIVDPAVMGGFANYEKAFFTDTYIREHPEDLERIEVLKHLIALQIPLLADGIRIHGEKSTEQLKPLHNHLVTCFQDLREKVEKHYGVITLRPHWCGYPITRVNVSPTGVNTFFIDIHPFLSLRLLLQPCSLTERKKSRVGSVVMPYIMSSTLRRMSTVSSLSSTSSGLSSSSASDGGPSRPCSQDSLLSHGNDRRASVLSRSEEDNRISRKNRKEWSVSKSQVLLERVSDTDEVSIEEVSAHPPVSHRGLASAMSSRWLLFVPQVPPEKQQRPKSLQLGDRRLTLSLFQGASSPLSLSIPLSPLPASPHTPRSSSFTSLPTDNNGTPDPPGTPPPMPPKKHLHDGDIRHSSAEFTPPLPVKGDARPPPPPPKTRKSMFPL